MPTLILENLPTDVLNWLQRQASQTKRSPEEAACLLEKAFKDAMGPRQPDFVPGEEISPPCDLPIPDNAKPVAVRWGEAPLPDPIIIEEESQVPSGA